MVLSGVSARLLRTTFLRRAGTLQAEDGRGSCSEDLIVSMGVDTQYADAGAGVGAADLPAAHADTGRLLEGTAPLYPQRLIHSFAL